MTSTLAMVIFSYILCPVAYAQDMCLPTTDLQGSGYPSSLSATPQLIPEVVAITGKVLSSIPFAVAYPTVVLPSLVKLATCRLVLARTDADVAVWYFVLFYWPWGAGRRWRVWRACARCPPFKDVAFAPGC